jgi:hypothetical protein
MFEGRWFWVRKYESAHPSMFCPSSACKLSLKAQSCLPHYLHTLAYPSRASSSTISPAHSIAAAARMLFPSFNQLFGATAVVQASTIAGAHHYMEGNNLQRGRSKQERQRNSVPDVYMWMGPCIFRCTYRMRYNSFWKLYMVLGVEATHQSSNR